MRGITEERAKSIDLNRLLMGRVYSAAKTRPDQWNDISPSLSFALFISVEGLTQYNFPLPNLSSIRAAVGLGLPCPCFKPSVDRVRYSSKYKAFWLEVSAKNKDGRAVKRFVLISEILSSL